jgi:hypothetical protein
MRSRPGFRAAARLPLLLALGCQLVLAQVGPRHVIELHGNGGGGGEAGPAKGQVQLAGKGLALIRFQGLRILTVEADADAYRMDAVRHCRKPTCCCWCPPAQAATAGWRRSRRCAACR